MERKEKVIEISSGGEFKAKVIEDGKLSKNDYFLPVYQQAIKEICGICAVAKESSNASNTASIESQNNIIAFCGERGQGKTSAMLTTGYILSNNKKAHKNNNLLGLSEIADKRFLLLDPIDPTKLEEKDNILDIIIARLFQIVDRMERDQKKDLKIQKVQEIYHCISNLYKTVNYRKVREINNMDYYEENLEIIAQTADYSHLKTRFQELIDHILNITKKDFLILQIDDVDLNINKAFDMVEDIRKHLIMPKVLILMAVKMEQLISAVSEKECQKNQRLLQNNLISNIELKKMSIRYIEKLIPHSRRIILPEVYLNSFDDIKIKYSDGNKKEVLDAGECCQTIQEQILREIARKTRVLLAAEEGYISPIMPKTMREMVGLLNFLKTMKDVKVETNDTTEREVQKNISQHNLNLFENYLLNIWAAEHLPFTQQEALHSIIAAPLMPQKNRLLVQAVYLMTVDQNSKFYKKDSQPFRELENLLDLLLNQAENISLGQINDLLYWLETASADTELLYFTFSIRVAYSIYLQRLCFIEENSPKVRDEPMQLIQAVEGEIFGEQFKKEYKKRVGISNELVKEESLHVFIEKWPQLEGDDLKRLKKLLLFANFKQKNENRYESYKVPLKFSNNKIVETVCLDATYAFTNYIDIDYIDYKVNEMETDVDEEFRYYLKFNDKTEDEAIALTVALFQQIISNMDIQRYLSKYHYKLVNKRNMLGTDYERFYQQIFNAIQKLSYLKDYITLEQTTEVTLCKWDECLQIINDFGEKSNESMLRAQYDAILKASRSSELYRAIYSKMINHDSTDEHFWGAVIDSLTSVSSRQRRETFIAEVEARKDAVRYLQENFERDDLTNAKLNNLSGIFDQASHNMKQKKVQLKQARDELNEALKTIK